MKWFKILVLVVALTTLTSADSHKFYVSITKIEYVEEQQSLQIISKIFIDDIEEVLRQRYDESITLASSKETEKDQEYIKQYLLQKLEIKVDGSPLNINYLGREYESDIIKIFMEVEGLSAMKEIEVSNSVLMDLFEEQQNIIHVKRNDKRRSLILEIDNPKGVLNFD